jgi:3-hydroxyisobutyrate dehydrogenase-like beta-hydroxyacid dehydrogenase
MSANLVRAGIATGGYDVLARRRTTAARTGVEVTRSIAELASRSPILLTSLPSSEALLDVASEIAAGKGLARIVIETSTLPIAVKERARDILAKARVALLDCPLSGTGAQARTRDLAVYASGSRAAYRKCVSIFEGFARTHTYLGEFGNGSKMKFLANLLVAIHNVSAAEAVVLARKAGIDPALAVKVLGDGAGASRMLQVRGPMMVERSWGQATMKVEVWQKDMRLIHEALQATDTAAPLFAACVPIYNAAMALGHAQDDTAAVYSVLEHMMGAGPGKAGARRAPKRRKA